MQDFSDNQGERGQLVSVGVATLVLCLLWAADYYELVSHRTTFWVVTVGMLGHMGSEAFGLWRSRDSRWLVAPPLAICAMTFFLQFAGTNVVYLLLRPAETGLGRYGIQDFHWMSRSMLLTWVGMIAVWAGYWTAVGRNIGLWLREQLRGFKGLKQSFEPFWPALIGFVGVSVIVRIVAISAGLYGYTKSGEKRESLAAFMQYLGLLGDLGMVALIVVALYAFSKRHRGATPYLVLAGVFTIELIFGVFSGYKKEVVYPAITVGVCLYIARGNVPWKMMVGAVFLTIFAYSIIEPLRDLVSESGRRQLHDVGQLSETVSGVATGDVQGGGRRTVVDIGYEFLNRKNLLVRCAVAVRAYDGGRIPEARMRFQRDMAMSPLYAVIPRLVWPSKPKQQLGSWFNSVVLGNRSQNAVGMSGIGYLYVAGGLPLIVIVMFTLGIWSRMLQTGVLYAGAGGVLMFIGLTAVIAKIPQPTYELVVKMIRYIPLLAMTQFMLFRR